jgi:general secretion pathway protein A
MYTAFYGLREKPFALSPDPRFLFLAESHREALAHILYGIDQGEGFIAITGEVGTGKTTLCRSLLDRLGSECAVAFLFNPSRSATELLQTIASEFGLDPGGSSRGELGERLNRFLLEKKRDGRRVLLIVDEAQNLSSGTLEQIRLLSNLETASEKLIQILLLGQPELDAKLDSTGLRQLRQRISVRWSLTPMSPRETGEYVKHRIRIAAGADREIFTVRALREIHRRTRGIPRLVNILCDRVMLAGYADQDRRIEFTAVKRVAREIPDARRGWRSGRPSAAVQRRLRLATLAGAALALAIGAVLGRIYVDEPWTRFGTGSVSNPPEVSAAPPTPETLASQLEEAPPLRTDELRLELSPAPQEQGGARPGVDPIRPLGAILAERDPDSGRRDAVRAILESFQLLAPADGGPAGPLSEEAALALIAERGLTVLEIQDGELDMLRSLNHPALLRLRADSGESRLVALVHLDSNTATCYGATDRRALRVPVAELEERWKGEAFVVWREFEEIPELIVPGSSSESILWLQSALVGLGLYLDEPSGRFDDHTLKGVRVLQLGRRLDPDGVVGPRTKMVIYDMLQEYSVPRLNRPEGSG